MGPTLATGALVCRPLSAGGIAAAFNTPITAVVFTLEEVVGDLNAKILGSIVIAAVVATDVVAAATTDATTVTAAATDGTPADIETDAEGADDGAHYAADTAHDDDHERIDDIVLPEGRSDVANLADEGAGESGESDSTNQPNRSLELVSCLEREISSFAHK